jgi:hypothetical protein
LRFQPALGQAECNKRASSAAFDPLAFDHPALPAHIHVFL